MWESTEATGRRKTLGLKALKDMFVENAEVKIKIINTRNKTYRIVKGTVLQKSDYLVAIKTSAARVESFNYNEFIMGKLKIILN